MPATHAPETGARKLASVSGASVIQSGAKFFWRQILESDRTVFYFATESGDHVIKILICDWSVINVVVVFVCWSCKFRLYFRLLKLFNLFSLFKMSWTDSEIKSLITSYSSMLVSGTRKIATGVKNRRQFSGAGFWSVCLSHNGGHQTGVDARVSRCVGEILTAEARRPDRRQVVCIVGNTVLPQSVTAVLHGGIPADLQVVKRAERTRRFQRKSTKRQTDDMARMSTGG